MSTVGVDLGGTKISAAIVDADGELHAVTTLPTRAAEGPEVVLDQVAEAVRLAAACGSPVNAVGVGTAGAVDPATGTIISSTDTFPRWVGTNLVTGLRERLGEVEVEVHNDVDAHALGESWRGAGAGKASMLMVAAGTGIGGALILDGVLRTGAHHIGGEIGHIPAPGAEGLTCTCGREGHLEALSAGPAIHRRYLASGGEETLSDTKQVMAAAAGGDELARRIVVEAAIGLGRAIAGIVTTVDPDVVVVGGGLVSAGMLWWKALTRALHGELVSGLQSIPVLPAALGQSAAIIGAAAPLIRHVPALHCAR